MIDYRLYERVKLIESRLDNLHRDVYSILQQQADMLEQIKSLKERLSDGSGK
jgi:hypothetical protein